jgi:hypothetical protein
MILRRILPLMLLLASAVDARGQQAFSWDVIISGEYWQNALTLAEGGGADETETLVGRFQARFASSFWSRRTLKYSLGVNLEEGRISQNGSDEPTHRLGWAVDLNFLPESPKQFTLRFGQDTYDWERAYGTDYSRRNTYWGLKGLWGSLRAEALVNDSEATGFELDRRTDESAWVRKNWSGRTLNLDLELRHYRNVMDLFRYSDTRQTGYLYGNAALAGEGNLWLSLGFQRQAYEDEDIGYASSREMGEALATWTQPWSHRFETQMNLRSGYSEDSDALDLSGLVRYRAWRPAQLELLGGYASLSSRDVEDRYPYYGVGLFLQDGSGAWSWTGRVGIREWLRNGGPAGPEQSQPYAVVGFSRQGERHSFALDANYSGTKLHVPSASAGGGGPGFDEEIAWVQDFFQGSVTGRVNGISGWRLEGRALYSSYGVRKGSDEALTETLTATIDAGFLAGALGVQWASTDQQDMPGGLSMDSWDAHGDFRLNTHLALRARYIQRDKAYDGLEELEEELSLGFDYAAGRFLFGATFDQVTATSEATFRQFTVVRAVIARRFGNE